MKIVKYELSLVHKKELILTMEDDVDSEDLLKIFLETQVKEEKEQAALDAEVKKMEEQNAKTRNRTKKSRIRISRIRTRNSRTRIISNSRTS